MSPKILLVDDHDVVRSGLKSLLDDYGWQVCGEAANGKEAVQKVIALRPNLVLMDITMPVMDGFEATRQIRRVAPQIKVIILSMHDSAVIVEEAKNAGASGYVVKSESATHLHDMIICILEEHGEPEMYA